MYNKIINLLEAHGVEYVVLNDNILCYGYGDSEEYDTITVYPNTYTIRTTNGETEKSLLHWLGY